MLAQIRSRGFTLIETTIVIAMIATVVMLSVTVYWEGMVASNKETVKAKLQMEGRTVLEGIVRNVRGSSNVVENFESYSTDATHLILATPAIDAGNNFIYSGDQKVYDHIIYYLDGTNLHKLVRSEEDDSIRYIQNNVDVLLLASVQSLNFTYDDPTLVTVREVSVDLSLVSNNLKTPIVVEVNSKGTLRNV